MLKSIAIAAVVAACFVASPASAANPCGPTVCSIQPFCGNPSLSAADQRCLFPVAARYCEVRVCAHASWWMQWTWEVLR